MRKKFTAALKARTNRYCVHCEKLVRPTCELLQDHLAACFGNSTADRIALLLSLGVLHVRFVFLQVVQRRSKIFLGPLLSAASFLLCRSGDDFFDAVLRVTKCMALLLYPAMGCVGSTAEWRRGELRDLFTSVKEIHAPTPLQLTGRHRMFHHAQDLAEVSLWVTSGVGDIANLQDLGARASQCTLDDFGKLFGHRRNGRAEPNSIPTRSRSLTTWTSIPNAASSQPATTHSADFEFRPRADRRL